MADALPVELVDPFAARYARTDARTRVTERRDPTAATQQVRWTAPGQPMIAEWDADSAIRFGYMANVIAFRCVQVIADDISSLPFRAGMDPDRPQDYNPAAPLAQFLGPAPGGPAPGLAARKLWAWTIAQRLVTGRNAWELELDGTRIVAIWPLAASYLKPVPTESGASWFSAFEYGRSDNRKRLPADRVFYGWDPAPDDFRQPMSALQACRYPLSIAVMGDRYSHAFLQNGAVPAAMVVTQAFADPKARGKFRQQWAGRYGGPDNAGRTAFAEIEHDGTGGKVADAIDVKVLGLPQKDAQFLEQHQAALQMVAIDLGVPWSRLDASGRTFDNASEEATTYWQRVLSLLHTVEDEINMSLAPRMGREVGWFDLSSIQALKVKPEPTSAKVGMPALYQSGIVQLNEARADYGLPPVDGGDQFITPEELAMIAAPPAAPTARSADASPPPPAPLATAPDPGTRAPGAPMETRAPTAAEIEARRARIWSRTNAAAVTLERQFERTFRRLFARQLAAVVARLTGKRGRQAEKRDSVDPASIFDPTFWSRQTRDLAADLYESIASAAAVRVSEAFGIDFDLTDPRVADYIQGRANQLAGEVTDTTYRQITSTLAEGAAAGDDTTALADRIRAVFADADKNRATVIARTEVVSAFNGSTAELAAMMPDDVVAGQEWIATRDARVRAAHAGADGQVRRIGQPFDVGGASLLYPGDPSGPADEVIQCRCTLALLTPEDMVAAAEGGRSVPLSLARAIVSMAAAGHFDEAATRTRLRQAVAA